MKTQALIWDLDGTLLNSYEMILSSLLQMLSEIGLSADRNGVLDYILTYSVADFLRKTATENDIPLDDLKARCSEISKELNCDIKPMKNAAEILMYLSDMGVSNFVYTHKGETSEAVLESIGLRRFFREIITAKDGFERKPSPQAVLYLIDKYGLEKNDTFYVGDRDLDVLCAKNAGIKSIFYKSGKECTVGADYVIHDLAEIKDIV